MRGRSLILLSLLFLLLAPDRSRSAVAQDLAGTWEWKQPLFSMLLVLNADGTGQFDGEPITYSVHGETLSILQSGEQLDYRFGLSGATLTLSGGDLDDTAIFTRTGSGGTSASLDRRVDQQQVHEQAAAPGAALTALAGVWVCEESSLDPQYYMSYTQYVTLFPDGTVGYAKAEGGATRTQVTESLERFRSWRNGPQGGGDFGRWQSDGGSITIQWNRWNNLVSSGQVDAASGTMTLSGMGVLQEGATMTFKRQS